MNTENNHTTATADAGPTKRIPFWRASAALLLVATILAGSLAMSSRPADAATPQANAYCQSYNGGVFTASAGLGNHAIFMAVQRRTWSGWSLVGYSRSWEFNSTAVTHDLWGRNFGSGQYRVTAWTYDFTTGALVGHEPRAVVHRENTGGYSRSYRTYVPSCRITRP